jgi:hypothetical protein
MLNVYYSMSFDVLLRGSAAIVNTSKASIEPMIFYFLLSANTYDINSIDHGKLRDNTIKLDFIENIP